MILTIAVVAAAFVLGPALGAAMSLPTEAVIFGQTINLAAAVGAAAITMVGNLIVNAIAPPPRPKLAELSMGGPQSRTSPTLAITGTQTRVRTFVDAGHRKVCDIPEPETGLQVKFSIRHCIAMALNGIDTGDRNIYTAETANRPDLMEMRRMVEVEDKVHPSRHAAEIVIDLKDGTSLVKFFDVGVPADDLAAQEQRLTAKFERLAEPILGADKAKRIKDLVLGQDDAAGVADLMAAAV